MSFLILTYQVFVDRQTGFEIHYYLQNKFWLRKDFNLVLFHYLFFFGTSENFVLFEVSFLLKLISFLLKSVLFTKSICFNLEAKLSGVNLLNCWVVTYLSRSVILFSTSLIFVLRTVAFTKLLVSCVLFPTSLIFCIKNSSSH